MARVVIIGGGVGGMTAAHELIDRGYEVTVLERRHVPGGKARSVPALDIGVTGPPPPGEHGFRFFPSFYRHVTDTMSRIPFPAGTRPDAPVTADPAAGTVEENLVPVHRAAVLHEERQPLIFPLSRDMGFWRLMRHDLLHNDLNIPFRDWLHFGWLMVRLLCACERRRFEIYEQQSWWDFSGAEERSVGYRNYLADGLTRTLVAAKSREMSARTGGYILLQLMKPPSRNGSVDRVLNGPTNDRWIDPWLELLRAKGVDYRIHVNVTEILTEGDMGEKVTGVTYTVRKGDSDEQAEAERVVETHTIAADKVIVAVPKEVMNEFATPAIKRAAPILDHLTDLRSRWMNGVIFYLRDDVPIIEGHTIYLDSPWALTSISQRQFWTTDIDFADYGEGNIGGILSVDVSAWDAVGLNGKTAQNCSTQEIIDEVWEQVASHVNADHNKHLRGTLERSHLVAAFVDTDITRVTIPTNGAGETKGNVITSAAAHAAADAAADVVDTSRPAQVAPSGGTDPTATSRSTTAPKPSPANTDADDPSATVLSSGQSARETDPIPSSDVALGPGSSPDTMDLTFNAEPLLINTKGSWDLRPTAKTSVEHLYLASDYVQTYIDLATMEGANEAARRAVNALLDDDNSSAERCALWPLHEPVFFRPFKAIDRLRFRLTHGKKRPSV